MKKILVSSVGLLLPALVFAQTTSFTGVSTWVTSLQSIVQSATYLMFGLAMLAFFWGLAKYIFNAGNEDKKEDGKSIMIWGVVALFIMASIWGIINFISTQLNLTDSTATGPASVIPDITN